MKSEFLQGEYCALIKKKGVKKCSSVELVHHKYLQQTGEASDSIKCGKRCLQTNCKGFVNINQGRRLTCHALTSILISQIYLTGFFL